MTKDEQRVYWVWAEMLSRCRNPNHVQYHDYGGRGITVSDDWLESKNFMRDMYPRPDGATLDRRNNSAGYSKENCEWVSRLVNNKNKRVYKVSKTGISGVTRRNSSYRAILRHAGNIVLRKDFLDFFEACCARKSAELIFVAPYLSMQDTK